MGNSIGTPNENGSLSSTKSLRKKASSSTLSSLKLYRQANRSETSLSSKMSRSSNFEKILDISKPTKFEHGIHVEYNRDSGKYMVKKKEICTLKKKKKKINPKNRVYPMYGNRIYQVTMSWIRTTLLPILCLHPSNQNVIVYKQVTPLNKETENTPFIFNR